MLFTGSHHSNSHCCRWRLCWRLPRTAAPSAVLQLCTMENLVLCAGDKVGGMFSPDDQMAESLSQAAARAGECPALELVL